MHTVSDTEHIEILVSYGAQVLHAHHVSCKSVSLEALDIPLTRTSYGTPWIHYANNIYTLVLEESWRVSCVSLGNTSEHVLEDISNHTWVFKRGTQVLIRDGELCVRVKLCEKPHLTATDLEKNKAQLQDPFLARVFVMALFFHAIVWMTLMLYPRRAESVDLWDHPDRFARLILEDPSQAIRAKTVETKHVFNRSAEHLRPMHSVQRNASDVAVDENKVMAERINSLQQHVSHFLETTALLKGPSLAGSGGTEAGHLTTVIGTASAHVGTEALMKGVSSESGSSLGGSLGSARDVAVVGAGGSSARGNLGSHTQRLGYGKKQDHDGIAFEAPDILGALPAEVIKKVIYEHRSQIRYCYELELQKNQNLAGRVAMRWVIGGDGHVLQVTVKDSSLQNEFVEQCLRSKIKQWVFPQPAGGGVVEVHYPFVFKSSE